MKGNQMFDKTRAKVDKKIVQPVKDATILAFAAICLSILALFVGLAGLVNA